VVAARVCVLSMSEFEVVDVAASMSCDYYILNN
jgi:hypothetical protein